MGELEYEFYEPSLRNLVKQSNTCIYCIREPIGDCIKFWGCGGHGEVSLNHPAATRDEWNRPVEATKICESEEAYLCKRCHGTGIRRDY